MAKITVQNTEMRTVASSSLGFAACLSKNPDFSQSSELPLFTKGLRLYPKLRNKTEKRKRFWRINVIKTENNGTLGENDAYYLDDDKHLRLLQCSVSSSKVDGAYRVS